MLHKILETKKKYGLKGFSIASKEKKLWDEIVQVIEKNIQPRICKIFEITFSNSERLEQFLKQNTFVIYC